MHPYELRNRIELVLKSNSTEKEFDIYLLKQRYEQESDIRVGDIIVDKNEIKIFVNRIEWVHYGIAEIEKVYYGKCIDSNNAFEHEIRATSIKRVVRSMRNEPTILTYFYKDKPYRMLNYTKIKINGEWVDGVIYIPLYKCDKSSTFVRTKKEFFELFKTK